MWPYGLRGHGRSGEETAAAHRSQDHVQFRTILQKFQCAGPLARDGSEVIVRVNHRPARLGANAFDFPLVLFTRRNLARSFEPANFAAVAMHRRHFRGQGYVGHHNVRPDPKDSRG